MVSIANTKLRPITLTTSITAYRPFIIGLLIVFGASYGLVAARAAYSPVTMYQLMNIFMGVFFIIFALPKFLNLSAFSRVFRTYDLISKRFPAYAPLLPFIELCIGVVLISNFSRYAMTVSVVANLAVAVISGIGVLSVVRSLRQNKRLDCACMGSTFKIPLSKVAIAENGVMFLMALGMLVTMQPGHMSMAVLLHVGIVN